MSFIRAASSKDATPIEGTRAWLHGVRLTSTGNSVLDSAIGGGVPLTGMTVISYEGRQAEAHAATLASLFVAQGLGFHHSIFLAAADSSGLPSIPSFLRKLPYNLSLKPPTTTTTTTATTTTDPAPSNPSTSTTTTTAAAPPAAPGTALPFCQSFDLARIHTPPPSVTTWTPSSVLDTSTIDASAAATYDSLLTHITDAIAKAKEARVALRIVVVCPVGPLWGSSSSPSSVSPLHRFLLLLRSALRNSTATVLLTLSSAGLSQSDLSRCLHVADVSMTLEAFADGRPEDHPPEFAEWHGFLTLRSLSRLHSLAAHSPDTLSYLFKRDIHKFKLEKPHLPPELSRSSDPSGGAAAAAAASDASRRSSRRSGSGLTPSSLPTVTERGEAAAAFGLGAGAGAGVGATAGGSGGGRRRPPLGLGMACAGGGLPSSSNPLDF